MTTTAFPPTLHSLRPGLVLTLLALLFGFGLGGVFGAAESSLKGSLKASADAVIETTYSGDAAKAKAVVDKSWSYLKRAHMHGGGMGSAALGLILLLAALPGCPRRRSLASMLLGAGALGYPVFWLLAGFAAPGLGGTDAAKASLAWLALPSSGAFLLGTVLTLVHVVVAPAPVGEVICGDP